MGGNICDLFIKAVLENPYEQTKLHSDFLFALLVFHWALHVACILYGPCWGIEKYNQVYIKYFSGCIIIYILACNADWPVTFDCVQKRQLKVDNYTRPLHSWPQTESSIQIKSNQCMGVLNTEEQAPALIYVHLKKLPSSVPGPRQDSCNFSLSLTSPDSDWCLRIPAPFSPFLSHQRAIGISK